MAIYFGLTAALFVGFTLGFLGGGGSILTVPVLVYLFRVQPAQATGYSLLVVGATSFAGAVFSWTRRQVDIRAASWFAVPSLTTVYLIRRYITPALPMNMYIGSRNPIPTGKILLMLFAATMVAASTAMLFGRQSEAKAKPLASPSRLIVLGLAVGTLSGFLGAGGGFLIVPSLMIFGRLPARLAIGTSMVIIAAQSLLGFAAVLQVQRDIDWRLLTTVTLLSLAGMTCGIWASKSFAPSEFRKLFGWFVLVIAIIICAAETSR